MAPPTIAPARIHELPAGCQKREFRVFFPIQCGVLAHEYLRRSPLAHAVSPTRETRKHLPASTRLQAPELCRARLSPSSRRQRRRSPPGPPLRRPRLPPIQSIQAPPATTRDHRPSHEMKTSSRKPGHRRVVPKSRHSDFYFENAYQIPTRTSLKFGPRGFP